MGDLGRNKSEDSKERFKRTPFFLRVRGLDAEGGKRRNTGSGTARFEKKSKKKVGNVFFLKERKRPPI